MLELWWHNLILPLQIYYAMGILAGIALAIEGILALAGLGSSDLADASFEQPDQMGMLSLRTITAFFFGFGWAGVIAIHSGLGLIASIGVAGAVGMVFLLGIYLLMRALHSLDDQGNLDYKNAIGQVGTVYVTVPPARATGGQIEVLVQGRLHTISCLTTHSTALTPGSKIKVTGLIDQETLEVQPLS
mgnify:CR=1 FL=1|jgi:membrane protein implicated in regulation of membrane protease activity